MLNFMNESRVSALLVLMWNLEGREGLLWVLNGYTLIPGQFGKVHPEELVFHKHSGKHHLEPDKVWTLGADNIEVHGVVHTSHFEHLQVGAGVALEETNEISGEVLVGKVEVELRDAVVQTVAYSCTWKLEYPLTKDKGLRKNRQRNEDVLCFQRKWRVTWQPGYGFPVRVDHFKFGNYAARDSCEDISPYGEPYLEKRASFSSSISLSISSAIHRRVMSVKMLNLCRPAPSHHRN